MTGETNMTGGCACGATRYRVSATPMFTHCCHCSACQTETGSAFAINAILETDRITPTKGETEAVAIPTESGDNQIIHRCPTCRTALWSVYLSLGPYAAFLRGGTLDDPSQVAPDIHIYTRSKLPWVVLPDGVQAVPVYYKRGETWPDESRARLRAVRAAWDPET